MRAGAEITINDVGVPKSVTGPVRRGQHFGYREVLADGKRIAAVPIVSSASVPAADLPQRTKDWFTDPLGAAARGRRAGRYGARGAPDAHAVRRGSTPALGAGGRMILTVTLNTAIDKTLAVPNFRLGRRHRTVEQTTMPGGKGVNVARVLKTLGAPVIATGLAGGATGTRLVEQLTQLSVLSDFVRIREESRTNTAVIDPTTGEQTEINERGPAVSEQEIELFVDKLLYLAKGASMCVFAGSLPRNVDVDVYAGLIRELKRLGVVTRRRHRRRPAAPRGPRRARRDLAERARGRGARRPRVQRRGGPLHRGARDGRAGRARGDHDGAGRLLRADASPPSRARRRRCTACACARARSSRARRSARATRSSPGFVAARYNGLGIEECLVHGVACGAQSTQHLGAGLIDPGQVERLIARDRGRAPGASRRGHITSLVA